MFSDAILLLALGAVLFSLLWIWALVSYGLARKRAGIEPGETFPMTPSGARIVLYTCSQTYFRMVLIRLTSLR